jgi:hypothetical protein
MGQRRQATAVRTLNNDLLSMELFARLQGAGHPALVVTQRRAVAGKQLERATEAIDRIVQLWLSPPELHGLRIEIGDQPFRVARVSARGEFIQQAAELLFAASQGVPMLWNLAAQRFVMHDNSSQWHPTN